MEPLNPKPWPRRRWWWTIALVFALHVGLIFAFGDRKPVVPRRPAAIPRLSLLTDGHELLALENPTLFALPHPQGFAGATWLRLPQIEFPPFRWTETPRWLALPVEKLGDTFAQFMQTNAAVAFQFEIKSPAELPAPLPSANGGAASAPSALHLGGDLANRRLLNPPELRAWPHPDLLTNSVAQAVVDAEGRVISAKLLRPGSGSPDADKFALEQARAARFEPARNGGAKVSVGWMIFQWQTVPVAITNLPGPLP